jgi:hypothetical protein
MKKILESYYKDGLVYKQTHPTLPLIIWNYTEKVQYENLFKTHPLLLQCRGLITNNDGHIIVKPISKFFNYEELLNNPENVVSWKDEYVYVQNKEDGSMLILFYYENQWVTATRGSFTSEQSIKGMEILKNNYNLDVFEKSVAYIGEVIYPENRICVNYGKDEKVMFITTVPNMTYKWSDNNEIEWTTSLSYFKISGIKKKHIVQTKQYFSFGDKLCKELKELNTKNKEGFVLRFFPSNFRLKIKFEDYINLHRIVTGISNVLIWEYLKEGKSFDELIQKVPDEFYKWVKKTESNLISEYTILENEYKIIFNKIKKEVNSDNRKLFAEYAKNYKHSAILFRLLDNSDYNEYIWKVIKPEFKKPFN